MKKITYIILIAFCFVYYISEAQTKQIQSIKQESIITYQLTHPLHEVEATSKESSCSINIDAKTKEIKNVMVQVDVMSFNSGNSSRDSHAMEVVDALSYPDVQFTSSYITQKGDSLKVDGKLTFHGVTKDILISASSKWIANKLEVKGKFEISLTAFKIERPSLLLIPVSDELKFTFYQTFNVL